MYIIIRTETDVCPNLMISRTRRLFLSADPDEVSQVTTEGYLFLTSFRQDVLRFHVGDM